MAEDNKNEASDGEIISYLTQSGFTEDEIKHAMKETSSRDIDLLVNFIINTNQSKVRSSGVKQVKAVHNHSSVNEAAELSKKRKEAMEKEKLYREKLIGQIKADMAEKLEKDRLENEQMISASVEKTEDIADCKIKLWLGDGNSSILGFSKEETIEDVFKKIEAKLNKKGFNLFRMNQAAPIERSNKKLSETPELYPRAVLFVEE